MIGREFEDQWERMYVPVIGLKYQNMRCNLETTYEHSILVSCMTKFGISFIISNNVM
jgi:hypothetical protein